MKKIFTLLSLLYLIPALSHAQFTTGQKLIGGNVSLSTNSGNATQTFDNRNVYYSSNTGVIINPSIAKFISPTKLLGIGIVYNYSNYSIKEEAPDNGNSYKNITHSGGINIFSQRFIPLKNNFFFTIQTGATALYSFSKQSDFKSQAMTKTNVYGISASLAPGLSYRINNRFLFDAFLSNILSVGYQHSSTITNYPLPNETKTYSNSFNISTSFSNANLGNVGLGFRWLLKRK